MGAMGAEAKQRVAVHAIFAEISSNLRAALAELLIEAVSLVAGGVQSRHF
jgi:hypothetical protein